MEKVFSLVEKYFHFYGNLIPFFDLAQKTLCLKSLLTSLFQREEYNLPPWKKGDCFALLAMTIFYPGMWNLVPLDVLPVSV